MTQQSKKPVNPGWAGGLPPELMRSAPRPVRLTAAGKVVAGLALLITLAALVAAVALYELAQRDRARLERIRREALATEAEVIQTGVRGGSQKRRWIVYQYRAGDRPYRGRITLPRQAAQGIAVGSRLRIGYLPDEPERSWLVGREPSGLPLWAAVVIPLGAWLLVLPLAKLIRWQWRLLAEGRVVLGTVVRMERLKGKWEVSIAHYEFPLLSGARESGVFSESARRAPAVGDAVIVVYDPDNPRRNARYPLLLVRADSNVG